MTRRVSRGGRTYSEGSSSTPVRDPWPWPMICCNCSRRIYPSKEGFEQRATHRPDGILFQNFHLPKCPEPL